MHGRGGSNRNSTPRYTSEPLQTTCIIWDQEIGEKTWITGIPQGQSKRSKSRNENEPRPSRPVARLSERLAAVHIEVIRRAARPTKPKRRGGAEKDENLKNK